jgi:hypothetical protein
MPECIVGLWLRERFVAEAAHIDGMDETKRATTRMMTPAKTLLLWVGPTGTFMLIYFTAVASLNLAGVLVQVFGIDLNEVPMWILLALAGLSVSSFSWVRLALGGGSDWWVRSSVAVRGL